MLPILNAGVMFGFTVTANVAAVAHCPAAGVNVYVPEFWLSTMEGFHVPVTPFADVAGKVGTELPEHTVSEVPKLNVGDNIEFTVTVNVTGDVHPPADGVNVYTPELELLTTAGLHVPLIPLVDVLGSPGTEPPLQMVSELPKLNVGVVIGFTVTVKVTGTAH